MGPPALAGTREYAQSDRNPPIQLVIGTIEQMYSTFVHIDYKVPAKE